MIRVGICDDELIVLDYLRQALEQADGFAVAATVADGESALDVDAPVDVWLIDIRMPGMDGLETARRIKARPAPPAVLLLTSLSTVTLSEAVAAGVNGFLHKDLPVGALVASIRAALAGVFVNSPESVATLRETTRTPAPASVVTDGMDREILRLVMEGFGYHEIAEALEISESTVKKRVGAMARRVGVHSRPRLMGIAVDWII